MSARVVADTPKWLTRLEVTYRKVASLHAAARNARTHTDEQVAQIAASITEFGWTNPVLIDEGAEIIAGHGRVLAATLLGADVIPCLQLQGLTADQKRAYAIADNKLALNAGWNVTLLAEELAALQDADFDLAVVGFNEAELSHLFSDGTTPPPDQASEWAGMPNFKQEDQNAFRTILMHFKDQEAVDAFEKLIQQKISEKARFLWFPQAEIVSYMDKRYVGSES